jgi:hypothetical protein
MQNGLPPLPVRQYIEQLEPRLLGALGQDAETGKILPLGGAHPIYPAILLFTVFPVLVNALSRYYKE